MLRDHEAAITALFFSILEYFWLLPIASSAIYGLFAWRHMATDRAALLFSVSIPGSTLLPVLLGLEASSCCGVMDVFSMMFPAIWILPLVSLWQGTDLLRGKRRTIGRVSIFAIVGLAALYPLTSFSFWYFNSIKSL